MVWLIALIVFCTLLFGYRLGERDLWSSHEGRAGQNARAIVEEGCWGLPHLCDFRAELQKPPLYYWLVALVSHVRGGVVDALSVRVPAALAGVLVVLLTCGLLWNGGRWRAGLLAAFTLATMVHFTALARTGRIDMPLAGSVSCCLVTYYLGWQRTLDGKRAWPCWLLAAFSCAAAILLKGPIGIVLPAAVVGLHLLFESVLARRLSYLREPQSDSGARGALALGIATGLSSGGSRPRLKSKSASVGDSRSGLVATSCVDTRRAIRQALLALLWLLPVILLLALPWFLWANHRTGGALWETFFLYHNVERAFGAGAELRSYPFWYYLPRLAIDLLPWSLLLPVALWQLVRQRSFRRDADARFGLVWLLAMLLALSCAGFKRADYLLPLYPGVALILGCWLDDWLGRRDVRPVRLAVATFLLAGCFLAGWGYYAAQVLPAAEPSRDRQAFARVIRQHAPKPGLVIFFRCEDHALAFHVGGPINTILEWENIDTWAGRPGTHYIVMPPDCARLWQDHVRQGRLEVVADNLPHDEPLILLRTLPLQKSAPARRQ